MRALECSAPGVLTLVERDPPVPGPGEVLVRVRTGGVCGTDIHVFRGVFGRFPVIPGHDVAGCIEQVGPGVSSARLGERVAIDPAACCARAAVPADPCHYCARGATHLCAHGTYMGMSAPGAFAELVAVPSARAVPLPPTVSDWAATMLEPVAVALHLSEQIADRPGPALVAGAGPLGVVVALVLRLEGRTVQLVEPLEGRRGYALGLGLDVAAPDSLAGGPPRAGVLIDASAHPSAAMTLVDQAAPGATLVMAGGPLNIPGTAVLLRELEVRAAKGGRGLYPEAIALVAGGAVDLDRVITHRFRAADAARAFQQTARHPQDVWRAAIDFTTWT